MYKTPKFTRTRVSVNKSTEGEHLHEKIERMMQNKEKLTGHDNQPVIYTDRKEGVRPNTDIRTDKWAVGAQAADAISRGYIEIRNKPKIDKVEPADDSQRAAGYRATEPENK